MSEEQLWQEYLKKAEKVKKEYNQTIDRLRQDYDKKIREMKLKNVETELVEKSKEKKHGS